VVLLLAGAGYGVLQWVRPQVTVTQPVRGPVVQAFYATGTILPEREYPIRANVPGVLVEVKVDKGDHVKRDQPVAKLEDLALKFAVDKAAAELVEKQKLADDKTSPPLMEFDAKIASNRQQQTLALREKDRMTDLVGRKAVSELDLDQAIDHVLILQSEGESFKAQRQAKKFELQRMVDVAKAALETAQAELDKQNIRSPIDGVVLDWPTPLGTRVAVNDHLMQVADVAQQNLVMRAQVDEEDVGKLQPDQTVRLTLYAYSDKVFQGKVKKIYDKADPERRTFEVDVQLEREDYRLAAGMTGELAFIVDTKDEATVLPAQAVQNGAVWVVEDGKMALKKVRTGLKSVERIEIISGVSQSDRVVISPIDNMREGEFVRTIFIDPLAASQLNKKPELTEGFKGFR